MTVTLRKTTRILLAIMLFALPAFGQKNIQKPNLDMYKNFDRDISNQKAAKALPFVMNFEDTDDFTGWSYLDANADDSFWGNYTDEGINSSNCAGYKYNETNNANDWLFSPAFNFESGKTYSISFYYKAGLSSFPEKIKLCYGTSNQQAMENVLADLDNINSSEYQKSTSTLTVTTTGAYYLGWHCYSNANMYYAFIDSVMVTQNNTQTPPATTNWEWKNPLPQGNRINDVYRFDNNNAIAVGASGSVLKTTDAGANWQLSAIDTRNWVNGVHFVNTTLGFACAANGNVYKTTDAGATWATVTIPTLNSVEDIWATSANNIIIVTHTGQIFTSADAGDSWTSVTHPGSLTYKNKIYFTDANNGFIVGGNSYTPVADILKTTDAGATWTLATIPAIVTSQLRSITFVNSTTGFVAGENGAILKTTDGGQNWNLYQNSGANFADYTSTAIYAKFYDIAFFNETDGIVAGESRIYYTTDAGETWTESYNQYDNNLRSILITGSTSAIAMGDGGIMLTTTNKGQTWELKNNYNNSSIRDIDFAGTTGYAVIDGGKIIKSADDGQTWQNLTFSSSLRSVLTLSANVAITGASSIYKTTDGGTNWDTKPVTTNGTIYDIHSPDQSVIYGVGYKTVIKSTDIGETWSTLSSPYDNNLNGVFFIDNNTGIAVGGSYGTSKIYRTTNGAASWDEITSPITNKTLNSVAFVTATTGFICGDDTTLLKTTDGGLSWAKVIINEQLPSSISSLYSISFGDENHGIITGAAGLAFTTTDGGNTWQIDNSVPTNEFIYAATFSNSKQIIGGQHATLITANVTLNVAQQQLATVTTTQVTDITQTSAQSGGNVTADGGAEVFDRGMVWGTTQNPTIDNNFGISTCGSGTGLFTCPLTSLTANTTYYVRAYATNSVGTAYGNQVSFTTPETPADITPALGWVMPQKTVTGTMYNLHMPSTSHVYAVGQVYSTSYYPRVYKSADAGQTWSTLDYPNGDANWNFLGVFFIDNNTGFVGGGYNYSGAIYKTTNGGTSWTQVKDVGYRVNDITFINNTTGYACASNGKILKTTDSGETWEFLTSGSTANLSSISFANANTGWVAGEDGVILKTTDGGQNWITQTLPLASILANNICAVSTDVAYANTVSLNERVYKTTDGGATWVALSGLPTSGLRDVYFVDLNKGWVATASNGMYYTNNGGSSWVNQPANSESGSQAIFMFNDTIGCAVGTNVLRTTNGGYTPVQVVANFSVNVTSGNAPLTVQFTDESTGNPTEWSWDFDNNGTADANTQNPECTFTDAGKYSIKLTVTNADGSNSILKEDLITVNEPVVVVVPTVTSNIIYDITQTTAKGGGNVTADGGDNVTGRGVVWAKTQNPTINNNFGITTNGSGTGPFSSNLTGLSANTTYYARAYATNSAGTAYGEQVEFTTLPINDEYLSDADDLYTGANEIFVGTQVTNRVHQELDLTDWFKIELSADKNYELIVTKNAEDALQEFSFDIDMYQTPTADAIYSNYMDFESTVNTKFVYNCSQTGTYYIKISAFLNSGRYNILVNQTTTNVPETNAALFSMFPNPANNFVTLTNLQNNNQNYQVDIINITGSVVYSQQFGALNSQNIINVSHLQKGIYFVNIKTQSFTITNKLIIE